MAPRWPRVNDGPEHINEHATYLKEACNQLQAVDRGRQNQVPWMVIQPYLTSTLALIGKVLRQPAIGEILQHVQNAAKCTQSIQKDVTIIKNSVGLSTTPLNAGNFSGARTTATSWAQVAAQAKAHQPPLPPAPHGITSTETQSTVTAYKDRAITVKIKDHGIAQRYRTQPATWIRQQVETSIRNNTATKTVKIVAAYQLKSGDIQIFTSTTTEASQLKQNKGWVKGLGERAELVVPTYGVIVHGIATNSINMKDQKAAIQQMLADNYTVIPSAEISHIGWLTKEATLKRASSIVVEFTDPEMANAIIYAGLAWDGLIHQCQLYDRACRVKQCFRCWHYGHIGTQCVASQQCGYCAEPHETRHCQQKGVEGFAPRCAVCKGAHTAWSNACLARKNELERVEAAKRTRDIYWHVPSKERSTRPRTRNTHGESGTQTGQGPITTNQGRNTTQATAETIEDSEPEVDTSSHTDGNAQPLEEHAAMRTRSAPRDERPAEITPVPATAPTALDAEEDWMTPIIDIEPVHQPSPPIDPQIQTTEQSLHTTQTSENNPRQPPECPPDGIERAPAMQQAEDWLDNFITDFDDGWAPGLAATETQSPPTSIVTDPRTAQGATHRGCSCP